MARNTFRKNLIRTVVEERRVILLEELRWIVLQREAEDCGKTLEVIERGPMQSFARTVRDHMPEVPLHEIGLGRGSECPLGLAAGSAVYRLRERVKLEAFLGGPSPAIECQLRTDLPVSEFGEAARYAGGSGFAQPQYHLLLFDLYSAYEESADGAPVRQRVARVRIPPGHKVTIVGDWGPDGIARVWNPRWRLVHGSPVWPVHALLDA